MTLHFLSPRLPLSIFVKKLAGWDGVYGDQETQETEERRRGNEECALSSDQTKCVHHEEDDDDTSSLLG